MSVGILLLKVDRLTRELGSFLIRRPAFHLVLVRLVAQVQIQVGKFYENGRVGSPPLFLRKQVLQALFEILYGLGNWKGRLDREQQNRDAAEEN